ncbi:MAG: bifunctional adenosylcobinamide kinase/adenosylcobinamide-phosphate guanylyltransferase [Candidatus Raymondbacteria bacterium RifOxyA12_full_50_37]|uniref:Adenosylcobinamide kinase n=1 Tax=Candidatus Raymondbacteria bacterium RIFOXYD12_FULL_49_13 TaxID=1817890 RepID=A0A1F7FK99_UNCRA|nr:MAG: bifunctional adenosylcobinamide kinase/adenosylcobinamide-phosphate guanylyltransferase [Candidatus Raymondbacteria bacterium RifOxyA12_full_50_37]OGJ90142.1 MAG: bifunctional adenosylcobinamide kinase/adenosylcobinamide-phosphate guanylyltransferase [Candidatus Raymondbacteria bacterium RIFOXYA2_FULL_49_16]OGJ97213.1 MAG: bifunctional adenosylcobinamide kinase/adenosylcobinamide-phosphate guanylyltransferase [Candidatus Raymondbacteria bacterium RIFOXYC2_FULL_50_21]OGK04708.1 MAG: bifun
MAKIILVTGACRSGKSAFAQTKAAAFGEKAVFVATAEAIDGEMAERIAKHKQNRNPNWEVLEAPVEIGLAVGSALTHVPIVIVDCITIWVANLMHYSSVFNEEKAASVAEELVKTLSQVEGSVIFVTNEVGWGIVPADPQTRLYRDCAGRINQIIANAADEVYMCVCGIAQKIK